MDKETKDFLEYKQEPFRKNLIKLSRETKRKDFTAIFANEFKQKDDSYIYSKRFKGQSYTLLKCLCDENENKIAEHVWVLFNKKMKSLNLQLGDKIKFQAKVYKYAKNASMCEPHKIQQHWSLRSIIGLEKIENVINA